ncbi:hypothetical protein [Anabaena lutea]|uniref:Uncharacterized protein n=1 Tax=Anabaena lutea FACHB-196 TaxID=2692881 RepID=A0ABR8FM56_9NOST|nr:hypothetical protein [Anabaena lutea]MBD2571068.1 hypothetical protein [Anabaena lutea FACHB-196]
MVKKKSAYRIDVGATGCVYLKAYPNVIGGIATEIGWTLDDDGVPPAGKVIIAENRSDALDRGLVAFRITYKKNKKRLGTVILVAPDKADTAKDELLGKAYNGGVISKVTSPRRVKYVAG